MHQIAEKSLCGENRGQKHQPAASHWQTFITYLCIEYISLSRVRTRNGSGDSIGSCKSNYHTITTAPWKLFIRGNHYSNKETSKHNITFI
jgi:hypothetical protein